MCSEKAQVETKTKELIRDLASTFIHTQDKSQMLAAEGEETVKRFEAWETKDRLHVRGLDGDYNLAAERRRQRDLPRIIKAKDIPFKGGPQMFNKVMVDPKISSIQSMYCHIKDFVPGTMSQVHGHQNDALMYILQGQGYDLQDGLKVEWSAGDLGIIRHGTVHQHIAVGDEPCRVLIVKSKTVYAFLNMIYQQLLIPSSKEQMPGWEGYKPLEWTE